MNTEPPMPPPEPSVASVPAGGGVTAEQHESVSLGGGDTPDGETYEPFVAAECWQEEPLPRRDPDGDGERGRKIMGRAATDAAKTLLRDVPTQVALICAAVDMGAYVVTRELVDGFHGAADELERRL